MRLPDGRFDDVERVLETPSSNGVTIYTTILWKDAQVASCNCPGWVNNRGGQRYCKHVKALAESSQSTFVNDTEARRRLTPEVEQIVEQHRGLLFLDDT